MAVETPICDFGRVLPDFNLPGIDGRMWNLQQVRGPRGVLIMFICNHCPYVQAVIDRIVRDVGLLRQAGIGAAAIMSNDAQAYPDDSFANMALFAARHGIDFPYLYDETQQTARAYDAACTPDFFGADADLGLQYRGRLDSSGRQAGPADARRELLEAMTAVAETGKGPDRQVPSLGCSIKWRME